tara:strand:+ start:1177 stop:1767 length:591 start_codon:yes stop_codon:yes gene_type:complete
MYEDDEDRDNLNWYLESRRLIKSKKYRDLYSHYEKWHNEMKLEGCWEEMAISSLHRVLEERVKLLKKVAVICRNNAIEELPIYKRWRFLQGKIKNQWHHKYELGELCFFHLLNYPVYRLSIRRTKNMYTRKERAFMNKWELMYMPSWLEADDSTVIWKKKPHRAGILWQYLGEDGKHSTHNKWCYEFLPTHDEIKY